MNIIPRKIEGKPLISISIPVLNEADNLYRLYERLCVLASKMQDKCELEFVFSDNHSNDNTWRILQEIAAKDRRVKAIRFSKNVGFQRSILANYMHTSGDAVMQIDADLQDPPELLEEFFELWKQGYYVVYGIRKKRKENFLLNAVRKVGYWVINQLSEHPIPRDVGDFRLIDKAMVHNLTKMRVTNPYLRGMIANMGFEQTGVPYARDARIAGKSKFNFARLVRLGLTAVFNHSTIPLRVASCLGIVILIMSIIGVCYYIIMRLNHPEVPHGVTSIIVLLLFGIGLLSFLLGIIGEYILRIYLMLRAEPIAVIEQSVNFDEEQLKL